jgi:exo-1,4-beta-D-glucosaminidase
MAALVANNVYPNVFFGTNLKDIPGSGYAPGPVSTGFALPARSPFRFSWWFHRKFQFTRMDGQQVWLQFDGINYRANIWLNGHLIADSKQIAGAYRMYDFNITPLLAASGTNGLAIEVFAPTPNDLAIEWVDWNPTPPDKNMGLWRGVYLATNGPVALRFPQVITKLDLPSLDKAHLTISAEVRNCTDKQVNALLKGEIEKIQFVQRVLLAPNEIKVVRFYPQEYTQLNLTNPRLWWPVPMGPQNLYKMDLRVEIEGKESDRKTVQFGVRQVASELNEKNYRVFKINGKNILIRGGGWAPDMFLRADPQRELAHIRYIKDMNLNTIRFEGKTEDERFISLCDREGILVISGWCCCSHWEHWRNWTAEDHVIAADSMRDQARRLRNHPSLLTWWYGSDGPPPPEVEKKYLAVLKANDWPNPSQSSAMDSATTVTGHPGLKMTGPYEWVPPSYWLLDTKHGGAYSFNTETSPGPAVPPIESLRKMIPQDHLWPIDQVWNYHAGGSRFTTIAVFTEALNKRMGPATGVEDFARKAQLMTYEGQRAMFEAYARNKYHSTGVIQWMMNNAWPSLIWHLYDYFMNPGGGYFGTKKACEPLHIQYSYDDRSIVVVNSFPTAFQALRAKATAYNLDMTEKYAREFTLDAGPDSSNKLGILPEIKDLTSTYFVYLTLNDSTGKVVSTNLYWLSTKPEIFDESQTKDTVYTPTTEFADFTALARLPEADVTTEVKFERREKMQIAHITLENPGSSLAFFIRLRVTGGREGEDVLPIVWQDNYVSLFPGEKREITAEYALDGLKGAAPVLQLEGWNVKARAVLLQK